MNRLITPVPIDSALQRPTTSHLHTMSTNENAPEMPDVDDIMSQLVHEFTQQNGRAPNADELKQWQEQLRAAMEEGLVIGDAEGEALD